jgi:hypothetical protein
MTVEHPRANPAMVLNPDPKYPNRRAYVIKVRGDATPDVLRGRVENLLTCEQHEFASALELVELIEVDLQSPGSMPGGR